jgi:hypothetical protein
LRKNSLLLVIAGGILLVLESVVYCQPLSNEQIVINSVKAAVAKEIPVDSTMSLKIAMPDEELGKLVGDGISEALQGQINPGDPSEINLTYEVMGFDFSYKKGKSLGFLKSHQIARDFRCQLHIAFRVNSGSELLRSQEITVAYHDEIRPSDLNFVKSRRIPELAPVPPGSGWSRYAEPSLVIASIGTLVYLFFANR